MHLLFGLVDGRHDDVRRSFTGQLDDVFAHVGFQRLEPRGLHGVVEADLLADHRLALGDEPRIDASGDAQRDGIGLIGRLRPMHPDTVGGEIAFELFQQIGEIGQSVAADGFAEIAQRGEFVLVAELGATLRLQEVHRATKILALGRIVERGEAALLETLGGVNPDRLAHGWPPLAWQSRTITSLGPWAP
ncbi:MAG: hypothetical protein NT042_05830 [Sulfuritalea sp.]|nr:hypothetical protein [Sulfuritalea sp.]